MYFTSFPSYATGLAKDRKAFRVPNVASGTRRLTGRQGGGRRRGRIVSYKNDKNNILHMYTGIQKTINNLLDVTNKEVGVE